MKPTDGDIFVGDTNVANCSEDELRAVRKNIGYLVSRWGYV